jgi:two-component system cell cycle response regulator/two-component system cell cycle response regulator DivK
LTADDTASSRDLLRSILEADDYIVAEAVDGEQVLKMIESFRPDLVILDLHLPRLDGFATAAALRKIPAFERIPIIALTAAATETAPERISEAGFSAYLVKPIRPADLRRRVAGLLGFSRSMSEVAGESMS